MGTRRARQAEAAAWEEACQALRQQRADARGAEAAARAASASAQSQQVPGSLCRRLHMQPVCHAIITSRTRRAGQLEAGVVETHGVCLNGIVMLHAYVC